MGSQLSYILIKVGTFESSLIRALCDIAGIQKTRTMPYHPMGNGQCERMNRTLLDMLGTLSPEDKENWKKHTSTLVHAFNCTRRETTGFEPYFLMFGWKPRLPVNVSLGVGAHSIQICTRDCKIHSRLPVTDHVRRSLNRSPTMTEFEEQSWKLVIRCLYGMWHPRVRTS